MPSSRLLVLFIAIVFSVNCGGDDGGESPAVDAAIDAKVFQDAPPATTNALGQLCPAAAGGGGTPCPANHGCVTIMGVGTNTTTGYCTPMCMNSTAICTAGYTGPAGGQPMCVLGAQGQPPDGCAIVCTDTPQCPTGMTCTQVPQQQVKICVPT